MPSLGDYGVSIAATTARIQQVISGAVSPAIVTKRIPQLARAGVGGTSVNLFLYRDEWVRYRSGGEPRGTPSMISAELHYLVTAYPPGGSAAETDGGDPSLHAHGAARAALENNPVLAVALPSGASLQAQLVSTALTLSDITSLWVASGVPLRLSFGVIATIGFHPSE